MDGEARTEVAPISVTCVICWFTEDLGSVSRPTGYQGSRENGWAEDADPEAGLRGHVGPMFSTDNVVGNAPNEGAEGKQHHQNGRQGERAASLAVCPLILHNAG